MKTDYLKPGELIIPLSLLAFIGPGITFINRVFNTTTRWGILAALSFFLLFYRRRDVPVVLRHSLFRVILAYAVWGLMTVKWSEVPQISLAKSLAFIWVSTAMLIAGYSWVMRHDQEDTCDFLWLFAMFALFAAPIGEIEGSLAASTVLYTGRTGNPNFLGFVLATASVWLLWRAYLVRLKNQRLFTLYVGLLVFDLYYLFLSHSRASLLMFAGVSLGLLLGLGKLRKWLPYVLVSAALFAAYDFSPDVQDFVTQYTFKSDVSYLEAEGRGIFSSREQPWQESYDRAMQGGTFGGGYGVTIGEDFHGEIGWTISSGQYGREHGNTQLAIIEQTGLIGFGLYLILIASIVGAFASGLRVARIEMDRVAIGLLGGTIFGMLVQSVFEAWWVAPGASESAIFWMLLGALLGATRRARLVALQSSSSEVLQAQHTTAEQSPAGVHP